MTVAANIMDIKGAGLQSPSMTIVLCIESGVLEKLSLRMVESLRRFGGRFANVEVVAVTPRISPPLARSTSRRMAELGIVHLQVRPKSGYAWHHYVGKVEAIAAVEARATTDEICWVDSDILFLIEPDGLELGPHADFAAAASDTGVIGSHGPSDPNDPFWQRAAAEIGFKVDDLPWLTTNDGHYIRFYWNSGLFVYHRKTGFGRVYLELFRKLLDDHVATTHSQVHFLDQVALGLTVLKMGLAWKALPVTLNHPVGGDLMDEFDAAKLRGVSVLHFHDAMGSKLWPLLMKTLKTSHPAAYDWLEPQGPIVSRWDLARVQREALRAFRGVTRRMYYERSKIHRMRRR